MKATTAEHEWAKLRLAELNRKIDEAPHWGAYVAALNEERLGIKRAYGL